MKIKLLYGQNLMRYKRFNIFVHYEELSGGVLFNLMQFLEVYRNNYSKKYIKTLLLNYIINNEEILHESRRKLGKNIKITDITT